MEVHSQFQFNGSEIVISDIVTDNYIQIDNTDYYLSYLDASMKGNKGGNSFVFALFDAQTYDENSAPIKVIKISKYKDKVNTQNKIISHPRNKRFSQEISALYDCKQRKTNNVIEIFGDGHFWCRRNEELIPFPFYVMEYAKPDLKSYMEENEVSESDRVQLCLHISQGIKELNDLGYYHRDIKPDNIFVVSGTWKIGDLGLISKRNSSSFDKLREFIGPRGWISPEAMNKYLAEGIKGQNFDCNIDHQSDLFQLGKVFWYILQGNAPIGCVEQSDFVLKNDGLYSVVRQMLCHSKQQRIKTIEEVIETLKDIHKNYLR